MNVLAAAGELLLAFLAIVVTLTALAAVSDRIQGGDHEPH